MGVSQRDKQNLLLALCKVLLGLDEFTPVFYWEIFGEGERGIFNLLKFKTFKTYSKYLDDCGLLCIHNRFKTTSFRDKVLLEISGHRLNPEKFGKALTKCLRIGTKGNPSKTTPSINQELQPLRDFWKNTAIKKWLALDQSIIYQSNLITETTNTVLKHCALRQRDPNHPPATPLDKKKRKEKTPRSRIRPPQRQRILSPPPIPVINKTPTASKHSILSVTKTPCRQDSMLSIHHTPRGRGETRLDETPIMPRKTLVFEDEADTPIVKQLLIDLSNNTNGRVAISKQAVQNPPTPMVPGNRKARSNADANLQKIKMTNPSTKCSIQQPRAIQINAGDSIGIGFDYCNAEYESNTYHFAVSKGYYVDLRGHKTKAGNYIPTAIVLPNKKKLADKTQETIHLKVENKVEAINTALGASRFNWPSLSRRILGGLFAYHPKVSMLAWEQTVPLVIGGFLGSCGLNTTADQLAFMSPCSTTCNNLVLDLAVDSAMLLHDSLEHSGIHYISYDKADSRKGLGGCVKLFATWDDRLISKDFLDGRVVVSTLDADKTGDNSTDVAKGVAHAAKKLDNTKSQGHGLTSDSGGGGNTEAGGTALYDEGLLVDDYLVGNCTLHNLNLEGSRPMHTYLCGSVTTKLKADEIDRNVETLMYAAFSWENEMGLSCMKAFWESATEYCMDKFGQGDEDNDDSEYQDVVLMFLKSEKGTKYIRMTRGSDTRWWSLGEAADTLLRTLPMRRFIAANFDDSKLGKGAKGESKVSKTARSFLSLSAEPALICDLAYMKCFHRHYLARHTKFMQSGDIFTQAAGFQAFSIFVRCFLMEEDYLEMIDRWEELEDFQDLVAQIDAIPRDAVTAEGQSVYELQKIKVNKCLSISYEEHLKMFARWRDERLSFLGAFSELPTGKIVALRLLGKDIDSHSYGDKVFFSENHQCSIHLGRFAKFVEKCIPEAPAFRIQHPHVARNIGVIQEIAEGLDIWNRTVEDTICRRQICRRQVLHQYGSFFTNNQGTERANKDQNLANSNNRGEKSTSVRMMAMTHIKELCETVKVLGQKQALYEGPERIVDMMSKIMSIHKRIEELKKALGPDYDTKRVRVKELLQQNFQKVRVEEANEEFKRALFVGHVKSAKENETGFDISPHLQGKLQFGKIFASGPQDEDNFELLKLELKGRREEEKGQMLTPEEINNIDKMGIVRLKASIQVYDEKKESENPGYNKKFFKVRFTDIGKYGYSKV